VLLVAPFCGEVLSTSTGPSELVVPGRLVLVVALYGCGALVCREVAHRCGLGLAGLLLLGAAYGVWEEAFVDRYWFLPSFWAQTGVGAYGVVGRTNVLLAVHLTLFHAAVSIGCSVLLVERLAPRWRDRPWVSRPVLVVAAVVLAATPLVYGEPGAPAPPAGLLAGGVVLVGLVAAAWWSRRARPARSRPGRAPRGLLASVAFGAVLAHWALTYGIAGTRVPWPSGVLLSVVPVGLGVLAVRALARTGPYGPDGQVVLAGLLAFFVLLDAFVALAAARYDLLVAAALTTVAVVWLGRGRGIQPAPPDPRPERTS
jgi:hypothetical protein